MTRLPCLKTSKHFAEKGEPPLNCELTKVGRASTGGASLFTTGSRKVPKAKVKTGTVEPRVLSQGRVCGAQFRRFVGKWHEIIILIVMS